MSNEHLATILEIRDLETNGDLALLYLTFAHDVVAVLGRTDDEYVWDPAFHELGEQDRLDYLEAQAHRLYPALRRAALTWAMFDCELVSEWRDRTGRGPRPGDPPA